VRKLPEMNIELLNTGSELMLGRVLNTHQQWLCRRLADLGYVVTRQIAVPDTAHDIQSAVREALGRADLIIATGGLGPTSDDVTRDLIAQLLGKKLRLDDAVLNHIKDVLRCAACRCQKTTRSRRSCPKTRWCWQIRTAPHRGWR